MNAEVISRQLVEFCQQRFHLSLLGFRPALACQAIVRRMEQPPVAWDGAFLRDEHELSQILRVRRG